MRETERSASPDNYFIFIDNYQILFIELSSNLLQPKNCFDMFLVFKCFLYRKKVFYTSLTMQTLVKLTLI